MSVLIWARPERGLWASFSAFRGHAAGRGVPGTAAGRTRAPRGTGRPEGASRGALGREGHGGPAPQSKSTMRRGGGLAPAPEVGSGAVRPTAGRAVPSTAHNGACGAQLLLGSQAHRLPAAPRA